MLLVFTEVIEGGLSFVSLYDPYFTCSSNRTYNFTYYNYYLKDLLICLDKMKEGEMGRACDTHRNEEKWIQGFGGET